MKGLSVDSISEKIQSMLPHGFRMQLISNEKFKTKRNEICIRANIYHNRIENSNMLVSLFIGCSLSEFSFNLEKGCMVICMPLPLSDRLLFNLSKMFYSLDSSQLPLRKDGRRIIPVASSESIRLVKLDQILYLKASQKYTEFVLWKPKVQKGLIEKGQYELEVLLSSQNIGSYEDRLTFKGFHRIHHGCIVNLNYVKSYYKGEGGHVVMDNGESIKVSRNRKREFLDRINS